MKKTTNTNNATVNPTVTTPNGIVLDATTIPKAKANATVESIAKEYTGIKLPNELKVLMNPNVSKDDMELVRSALNYQYQDLRSYAVQDQIKSLQNKIANKTGKYTNTQIKGFKEELEVAKTNLESAKRLMAYHKASFDTVIELSEGDEAHVERLLRLFASWYDNKYVGYVLSLEDFGENNIEKIASAMSQIHDTYDKYGFIDVDEKTKKRCTKMLNGVFRTLFSIFSDSNPFFRQMKLTYVKKDSDGNVNGELLHKIHQTWISGLRENIKRDDDGNVSRSQSTLVHGISIKKVNGVKKYDIKKFAKTICSVSNDAIQIFANGIVQSNVTITSIVEDDTVEREIIEKTETPKVEEKTVPVEWLKSFRTNKARREWLSAHNVSFNKSAKTDELEKLMIANYTEEEVA